jgi:hypothetical protein
MEFKLVFSPSGKFTECYSEHNSQENIWVYERGRKEQIK